MKTQGKVSEVNLLWQREGEKNPCGLAGSQRVCAGYSQDGAAGRGTEKRLCVVPVIWLPAQLGRVEGGAGAGARREKGAPACGITGGPGPCPAAQGIPFLLLQDVSVRRFWEGGGGGGKKDTFQLNNLAGINPYLPALFFPSWTKELSGG